MHTDRIKYILIAAAAALFLSGSAAAQGYETYVSPGYFGPNAFQVPEMNDGARTHGKLDMKLAGDYILGHTGEKDNTFDLYLELHIPLFTDRVNLSAWGALQEWYDQSEDVLEWRGAAGAAKGARTGPFFLSTDIQILTEKRICPALLLRAGLRTASENDSYPVRRSYDSAGYFFDIALGKTFGPLSLSLSTGFLCWQTGVGTQNDAIQFGAKASFNGEYVRGAAQYAGYAGWRHDGDFPRVLYLSMDFGPEKWYVKPCVFYGHGFNDWPFDLFRIGIKADVDILGFLKK